MSPETGGGRGAAPREPASWSVAGFLAAASLFAGLIGLVWYPGRVGPAAMLLALVASGMGGPHRRLAAGALVVATLAWLGGMVIAVLYDRPLF